MMPVHSTKIVLRWVGVICVLVSVIYLFNSSLAKASIGEPPGSKEILLASPSPTPPPQFTLHLPNVIRHGLGPRVEILGAWVADMDGNSREIFLLKENAQYFAQIINSSDKSIPVDLNWIQSGPCGETIVLDKAIILSPGEQRIKVEGIVPDCPGIYSVTVKVTDLGNEISKSTMLIANPLSLVAVENHQGFDKCTVPTISQMQTWWVESPYWAVNMYIGGISRACDQVNLTPSWMNAISQQGWTFIPTWVGPQAPCTTFRHRMSSNKFTAYQEGKEEAEMAAATGIDLGLWGDMVIYYDLEGYFGDSVCRNTVSYFVKGWVERLHQLGYQAGVYGGACSSSIADWAEISPAPDDVWIAHWYTERYDPYATVWDIPKNIPCLTDNLWANHQRIKQYAGGHTETYGGLSFSIDSNVLDGEVAVLPTPTPPPTAQGAGDEAAKPLQAVDSQAQVRLMQPLEARAGWVLSGEHLFMTGDGGASWQDITPQDLSPAHLLAVTFTSPQQGWVVRQSASDSDQAPLELLATRDGGGSWQVFSPIFPETPESPLIAAAYLNFVDDQTGFLVLKQQSSSAFSLGRLFATQDGGRTWEERSLPLGEQVVFVDAQHGWVAGGPGGDQLFNTVDGGRTWQPQSLPLPFSTTPGQVYVGLPVFHNGLEGSLPVTVAGLDARLLVYTTRDDGRTWSLSEQVELTESPGMALPFSAGPAGEWWAATPGANRLWAVPGQQAKPEPIASAGLPQGVIALNFVDEQDGWALVQAGICRGDKSAPAGSQPLSCSTQSYLLRTADGGQTWQEITP